MSIKRPVNLTLDDELDARLKLQLDTGIPLARVVRAALDKYLPPLPKAETPAQTRRRK